MKKITPIIGAAALEVTSLAGTIAIICKGCVDAGANLIDKGYKINKEAIVKDFPNIKFSEEENSFRQSFYTFLTYVPVVNIGLSLWVMSEVTKLFDSTDDILPYLEPLTEEEKVECSKLNSKLEKVTFLVESSDLMDDFELSTQDAKGQAYIKTLNKIKEK